MKIAIDISPLSSGHKVRGVGVYVSQLIQGLRKYDHKNDYVFFSSLDEICSDIEIVHFPYFDIFFRSVNFPKNKKVVVTVHDLTPLKFPKAFPAGIKGKLRWEMNKRLLQKADAVITDSESSKKDIQKLIKVSEKKIHRVYLAANDEFRKTILTRANIQYLRSKFNLHDNFFLYVGDVTWNKNLPRIVEAVKKANVDLVMVGKALASKDIDLNNPWNRDLVVVQQLAKKDQRLKILGYVSTKDLAELYNMATALVMPSLYEGFGLPVLEAMQSGCPVITSTEGSLLEVAGDAAYIVDAYDSNSIAEGIKKVTSDEALRNSLSKKGLKQANMFALEKMIRETVEVYDRVIK